MGEVGDDGVGQFAVAQRAFRPAVVQIGEPRELGADAVGAGGAGEDQGVVGVVQGVAEAPIGRVVLVAVLVQGIVLEFEDAAVDGDGRVQAGHSRRVQAGPGRTGGGNGGGAGEQGAAVEGLLRVFPAAVIPAHAGIQSGVDMDPGFRRGDGLGVERRIRVSGIR